MLPRAAFRALRTRPALAAPAVASSLQPHVDHGRKPLLGTQLRHGGGTREKHNTDTALKTSGECNPGLERCGQ